MGPYLAICRLGLAGAALAGCAVAPAARDEQAPSAEPVVLIIGDSISMQGGYFPGVVRLLSERYRVIHNPGNGEDSANVLAHLDEWVSAAQPDIVHFNCGLHDIKFDREAMTRQQEPDAYEHNLRDIVRKLKARTSAKLIFALTTPVNDQWHRAGKPFDRRQADVGRYNAIAREVMADAGIPVNDLHKVIVEAGTDTCLVRDGVHMNEKGNALLTRAVVSAIERMARQHTDK